jgi:hypothetical protein
MEMIIEDTKEVFAVTNNTDGAEGRGRQFNQHFCESKVTATRMGRGNYIQGSDCPITVITAVKVEGVWMVPADIHKPTKNDIEEQELSDKKESLMNRLDKAGISKEDIELIKQNF